MTLKGKTEKKEQGRKAAEKKGRTQKTMDRHEDMGTRESRKQEQTKEWEKTRRQKRRKTAEKTAKSGKNKKKTAYQGQKHAGWSGALA